MQGLVGASGHQSGAIDKCDAGAFARVAFQLVHENAVGSAPDANGFVRGAASNEAAVRIHSEAFHTCEKKASNTRFSRRQQAPQAPRFGS